MRCGVPGNPVWEGTIDGHLIAMQVRPLANGFRLAHQGFEVAVYVFTDSGTPTMSYGTPLTSKLLKLTPR